MADSTFSCAARLALAVLLLGLGQEAQAAYQVKNIGFRWVAPAEAYPQPQPGYPAIMAPAPMGLGELPPIAPMIIEGPAGQMVAPQPMQQQPIPLTQPMPMMQQVAPQPMPLPQQSAPVANGLAVINDSVVQGFGDNVPLSVALRQVLPSSYAYSVDPRVNVTEQVSWRGGAPWEQVLQNMLSARNLEARVEGQVVRIMPRTMPGPVYAADMQPMTMVEPPPAALTPVMPLRDDRGVIAPMPPSLAGQQPLLEAPPPMVAQTIVPQPMPMLDQPLTPMAPQPMFQPASLTVGEVWRADKGRNLRETLQEWVQRAGAELVWSADYDFPIKASISINGSFEDATRQLLAAFNQARPQPVGRLHDNPAVGQRLLVIETLGNNYGE